jgi:hypothetical protein
MKAKWFYLFVIIALLFGATGAMAEQGGGNLTCADVGDYEFSSGRIEYVDGAFTAPFPAGLNVFVTGNTSVSFTSSFGIGAVIVKGGNAANVYPYDPQVKAGSGLTAPNNPNGKPADVGNVTFCWNPEPQPEQWCSPGYWRQDHHLDSWDATGIDPEDLYSEHFSSPILPGEPTLLEVLDTPQVYGGPVREMIADWLSGLHPDVNFLGNRVEGSCPLD